MTPRPARGAVWAAAALAATLIVPAAASSHPTDAPDPAARVALPAAPGVRVDPSLASRLAEGPLPVLLVWDGARADRAEVAAYLRERGIAHRMLGALEMADICTAGAADIEALARAPGAVSVWGDHALEPALDRSVPTAFDGDPADVWSGMGIDGEGVTIAVVDTGIDASHPDLPWHEKTLANVRALYSHREILGPENEGFCVDVVGEDEEDTEAASGHGTHLAGVAAGDGTASGGRYRGVAPGASLVGVSAIEPVDPSEEVTVLGLEPTLRRVLAAIDWVMREGLKPEDTGWVAKVLLMGFTNTEGRFEPGHPLPYALFSAALMNITPVMPVGNDGPAPSSCDRHDTCRINPFVAGRHTIGVGATPRDGRTSLEEYSSRGDPVTRTINRAEWEFKPTLVAPGTGVVAASRPGLTSLIVPPGRNVPGAQGSGGRRRLHPDYQALTGTSVSAAHVAGAVALMQQAAVEAKGCFLTTPQVTEILEQTATPMPGYADWEVGAGALDVTSAVWAATFAERIGSPNTSDCPP